MRRWIVDQGNENFTIFQNFSLFKTQTFVKNLVSENQVERFEGETRRQSFAIIEPIFNSFVYILHISILVYHYFYIYLILIVFCQAFVSQSCHYFNQIWIFLWRINLDRICDPKIVLLWFHYIGCGLRNWRIHLERLILVEYIGFCLSQSKFSFWQIA